jgi:RES domain-containing protein
MNLAACPSLARRPLVGTWYRAINLNFWNTLLATNHTRTVPGRFNAGRLARPGFEILYLAEDHQVALFEVEALVGSPLPGSTYVPNPSGHWAVINVQLQLNRVVDFTKRSERRKVGTTVQELTGDWRSYLLRNPNPKLRKPYWTSVPTQKLGHALHGVRDIEAFLTYSARVPTRQNLIVFPSKLRPGSFLEFQDPILSRTHRIS